MTDVCDINNVRHISIYIVVCIQAVHIVEVFRPQQQIRYLIICLMLLQSPCIYKHTCFQSNVTRAVSSLR